MDERLPATEGFVPFRDHKTWYKIFGEEDGRPPLLALHGGPGLPHDYIESIGNLAATGRRVIFYDQLGCGNSDQPQDPALWTFDLFVEELETVRRELSLDSVHLLGQSWGGMLALQYALKQPPGLESLVLSSAPASMERWLSDVWRLRAELPQDVQDALQRHEEAGTLEDPEYEEAVGVFYGRHMCRTDPWPEYVERGFSKLGEEVFVTMYGPSDFLLTGNLKGWDVTGHLGEIRAPTLIVSGRYDLATPRTVGEIHQSIPGSRWVLFENSSHTPHAEEPERFLETLDKFLLGVEG